MQRENDIPESPGRSSLVTDWVKRVQEAEAFWQKAFTQMREDMDFAYGRQWPGGNQDRYVANIIQRHIKQREAAVYAKNPTPVARRKERIDYTLWDGKVSSLQMAVQAAAMDPMDPIAMGVIQDYQQTMNKRALYDRLARTLELVYGHFLDEQAVSFKRQMKALVRRVIGTGVGYVRLDFQRVNKLSPDGERHLGDMMRQLTTIERIAADIGDSADDPSDKEKEQLRLAMDAVRQQHSILVREGLVFEFPCSTAIIPCTRTRSLDGFLGSEFVAEKFFLSVDQVKEVYGVDLTMGGSYRQYVPVPRTNQDQIQRYRALDPKEKDAGLACVYVIYSIKDGLEYAVCEGWNDFLAEPAAPNIRLERFYPIFTLTFNEVEHETEIFPLSDARLLRDMQLDYNRARQGLREHRRAARPKTIAAPGTLSEEDRDQLGNHPAHAVIELTALQPGQKVQDVLQAWNGPEINPMLYEVNPSFEDVLRVVGTQEANLGGTGGATATESSIAEGSRLSSLQSNVDDLDDFLTEMSRCAGQVLLAELTEPTAKKIAGEGAVWPRLSAEAIAEEVFLEVRAGSTGRPNKAQEIQNMERLVPLLIQIPGIKPEALARELILRMDDKLEFESMFESGIPSIVAQNQNTQPSPGEADSDPNAQGARGGANAPKARGNEGDTGRPPGRPPMAPQSADTVVLQ